MPVRKLILLQMNPFPYLCWYDPRNPNYNKYTPPDIKPRNNCFCDNCFMGRDKLALYIIKLQKELKEAIEREPDPDIRKYLNDLLSS